MLSENATMVMRSKKEMFLRIDCGTIPEKKKAAVGVRGMRLDREDELTDIYLLYDQEEKEVEVRVSRWRFTGCTLQTVTLRA